MQFKKDQFYLSGQPQVLHKGDHIMVYYRPPTHRAVKHSQGFCVKYFIKNGMFTRESETYDAQNNLIYENKFVRGSQTLGLSRRVVAGVATVISYFMVDLQNNTEKHYVDDTRLHLLEEITLKPEAFWTTQRHFKKTLASGSSKEIRRQYHDYSGANATETITTPKGVTIREIRDGVLDMFISTESDHALHSVNRVVYDEEKPLDYVVHTYAPFTKSEGTTYYENDIQMRHIEREFHITMTKGVFESGRPYFISRTFKDAQPHTNDIYFYHTNVDGSESDHLAHQFKYEFDGLSWMVNAYDGDTQEWHYLRSEEPANTKGEPPAFPLSYQPKAEGSNKAVYPFLSREIYDLLITKKNFDQSASA